MASDSFFGQLIPNAGVYLQLMRFLVVLAVGLVLIRVVLLPVLGRLLRRRDTNEETRQSVVNLTGIVAFFLVLSVALQAGNFGNLLTIVGTVAAALTVAIGFGMRDQVSNAVAGILIYLYNPFLVGDYVESEGAEGVVEEITVVSTTLTGSSSETVLVPNSQLMMAELRNYTRDARTKSSIRVTLPNDNLQEGTELLADVAADRSEVLAEPEPDVFYGESDGDVYAELHYWLSASQRSKEVKSDILEEFTREAVEAGLFGDGAVSDDGAAAGTG